MMGHTSDILGVQCLAQGHFDMWLTVGGIKHLTLWLENNSLTHSTTATLLYMIQPHVSSVYASQLWHHSRYCAAVTSVARCNHLTSHWDSHPTSAADANTSVKYPLCIFLVVTTRGYNIHALNQLACSSLHQRKQRPCCENTQSSLSPPAVSTSSSPAKTGWREKIEQEHPNLWVAQSYKEGN